MRRLYVMGMAVAFAVGCSQAAPTAAPAETASPAAKLGVRPQGDTEIQPDLAQVPPERAEGLRLHRRAHRRARREPAEVDPAAEHLELGRGHPRVRRDGEGILRRARLPADADLRRRRHRVRLARQSRRLRQVRRGRREDADDLLDVRHDAGDAAGCLDCAALRRADRRAGAVQEGADRPRRHELQGAADVAAERVPRHQGGARQAAGEPDLRGRGRRGAHGHRPPQVRQGSSRAPGRRRRDAAVRRPVAQRQRQLRRRLGRLRVRRADDQRQVVGPRADGLRHPRQLQAQRGQPGVAPHQDARLTRVRRWEHAADRRASRTRCCRSRNGRTRS